MTYGKSMQCSKYSTPKKHVYRYMCIDICKLTNKVTLKSVKPKAKLLYMSKNSSSRFSKNKIHCKTHVCIIDLDMK